MTFSKPYSGRNATLDTERIVAYNSRMFVVIADSAKRVQTLGKFPLPVEVVPFVVNRALQRLVDDALFHGVLVQHLIIGHAKGHIEVVARCVYQLDIAF